MVKKASLISYCKRLIGKETGTATLPVSGGYFIVSVRQADSRMERERLGLKKVREVCAYVEGRVGKNHILCIQRGDKVEWHSKIYGSKRGIHHKEMAQADLERLIGKNLPRHR